MNPGSVARGAFAVIAGYIVFAVTAGMLFGATGHDPHAPASTTFMVLSTAYGIFFAVAGGYLTALIATRREKRHATILAALIAVSALGGLVVRPPTGTSWSQLATLIFMAPSAVVGGMARRAQIASRQAI